jgi:uncharacterized protein involved in high-affinity Fe2+ transport
MLPQYGTQSAAQAGFFSVYRNTGFSLSRHEQTKEERAAVAQAVSPDGAHFGSGAILHKL